MRQVDRHGILTENLLKWLWQSTRQNRPIKDKREKTKEKEDKKVNGVSVYKLCVVLVVIHENLNW